MKHNKCGHYFRRWMPAVWERSRVKYTKYTKILLQTLLGHLRLTVTLQMLCKEMSRGAKSHDFFFGAHGGIYSVNVKSPLFI